jgi:acetylornithine deacetylase/succinyl-diaminopimelate desuccinylase-like protein
MLRERHFDARLLEIPNAPPIVFGERFVPGAKHTFVFYVHYDGQPVTASEWNTPPFQPVLRTVNGEQRIYAVPPGMIRRPSGLS